MVCLVSQWLPTEHKKSSSQLYGIMKENGTPVVPFLFLLPQVYVMALRP